MLEELEKSYQIVENDIEETIIEKTESVEAESYDFQMELIERGMNVNANGLKVAFMINAWQLLRLIIWKLRIAM